MIFLCLVYIGKMFYLLTHRSLRSPLLPIIRGHFPNKWIEVNNKGTPVTKRKLEQCIWGAYTESDGIRNLQHATVTAYPPTHTHVTQYTSHLTSAISRDSTVWRHTITNACQDHILSHPIHNPITLFNIYHNSHFTTLITDNKTYS